MTEIALAREKERRRKNKTKSKRKKTKSANELRDSNISKSHTFRDKSERGK